MPKYKAYITYSEVRVLEVEADNEEDAKDKAYEHMDNAVSLGDDDYDIEVEEIIE